jgi:hypothetical protein
MLDPVEGCQPMIALHQLVRTIDNINWLLREPANRTEAHPGEKKNEVKKVLDAKMYHIDVDVVEKRVLLKYKKKQSVHRVRTWNTAAHKNVPHRRRCG